MLNNNTKSFFDRVIKAAYNNQSAGSLRNETEIISEHIRISKIEIEDLKNQLAAYQEREQLVSQVLISAQLNAHRIELEARENARLILEKCRRDLSDKKKALEKLRSKVSVLRKEFQLIARWG